MRRVLRFIIAVPIAILLLVLAIANRAPVLLSLDPLNPADPLLSVKLPLFVYLFLALILGVFIGGSSTWMSQARHRREARRLRRETARIKADAAKAEMDRARYGASSATAPSSALALSNRR